MNDAKFKRSYVHSQSNEGFEKIRLKLEILALKLFHLPKYLLRIPEELLHLPKYLLRIPEELLHLPKG